jgi:xanthine dehydrogenase accessory factor
MRLCTNNNPSMFHTELSRMVALAERLTSMNEHAVLATLFASSGSTYRELGSMMVSGFPLLIAGGVSGGCLEKYVARTGRLLTHQQPAAMLKLTTDPEAESDGQPILGCGGTIDVLVERLTKSHVEFLRQALAAHESDKPSWAAIVVNRLGDHSQQSIEVSRLWLDDTFKPGRDLQLERLHQRSMAERRSRHGVLDAAERRRALIHYFPAMTRLVILGAGDDVRPLCTLARSLNWHVTVADRRARLATPLRFPDANEVIADEWANALKRVTFTAHTAIVIMTHSLPDDIEVLPLLIDKPMLYLGILGPTHRHDWMLAAVAERVRLTDEFVSRIRGPVGLNLGDRSAAGIAVSIIAEIVACTKGRDARPLSRSARRSRMRSCTAATSVHD